MREEDEPEPEYPEAGPAVRSPAALAEARLADVKAHLADKVSLQGTEVRRPLQGTEPQVRRMLDLAGEADNSSPVTQIARLQIDPRAVANKAMIEELVAGLVKKLHEPKAYIDCSAEEISKLHDAGSWEWTTIEVRGVPLWLKRSARVGRMHRDMGTGRAIASYLSSTRMPAGNYLAGKRIIELACGVGCAGLAGAALGAEVTLTDVPYMLPLAAQNAHACEAKLKAMGRGSVHVLELEWFPASFWPEGVLDTPPYDLVLCADAICSVDQVPSLVAIMERLLRSGRTTLLWADTFTSAALHSELWREVAGRGLVAARLPLEESDRQASPNVEMYVVARRGGKLDPIIAGEALKSFVLSEDGSVRGVYSRCSPVARAAA